MDQTHTVPALTPRERAAAQAYLRLLGTVRAAFRTAPESAAPLAVPPAALKEAEEALTAAGLKGNEPRFFTLLLGYAGGGGASRGTG
ncbi:hypothetical protein [Streptomyces sp. NPDC050560]|uniref:hypothetical protein n=1 Tax=Streptomyces sp. NPDC050560 TaxID=3365630 RepID=UPI0037B156EC